LSRGVVIHRTSRRIRAIILPAFLSVLVLLSSTGTVRAVSTHYELDKSYYHPGDDGKLLLVTKNDDTEDLYVFGAQMNITGIGTFAWNGTGLPEAANLPPDVHGYLLRSGQTVNIEIPFKIPVDARPGEYEYTWAITSSHAPFPASPATFSDTLTVVAIGEEPPPTQPPQLGLLFAVAIAALALLVTYPLVRWKSKKAASVAGVGILALLASGILLCGCGLGFLFPLLLSLILTPHFLIPMILSTAIGAVLAQRKGRAEKRVGKAKAAPVPFHCPCCDRDLSTLPRDIAVCPYCGGKLDQRICAGCGKDLSAFPVDIKACPYCGKAVSASEVEAAPARTRPVKVELPESVRRIRTYTKGAALLGLLIAIASFIIGPLLGGFLTGPEPNAAYMFPILHEYQNTLWYGVFAGILTAVASGVIRFLCEGRTGKE